MELTFDVMRNASNKIAVALGADAPRVEHGTERYLLAPTVRRCSPDGGVCQLYCGMRYAWWPRNGAVAQLVRAADS